MNEHLRGHHRIAIQHSWKGCSSLDRSVSEISFGKCVLALNHATESSIQIKQGLIQSQSGDHTLRAPEGGSVINLVEERIIRLKVCTTCR
jgi:hypothetical protein